MKDTVDGRMAAGKAEIKVTSMERSALELYIHIPFCVKKCAYCDFLSFSSRETERREYVEALIKEIEFYKDFSRGYKVPSIFLGGGTPSLLEAGQMAAIMAAVRSTFYLEEDCEITVEANPGTVDAEKLRVYRENGINRLSFGLQSADNRELEMLGRIHTWEEFLVSWEGARSAGFDNCSLDLISAIPGQRAAGWEKTLRMAAGLKPEHISAYSLIVEEGTPFASMDLDLPEEEEEREIYEATHGILEEYGYRQYEISNYAIDGRACRHNCGYWRRENYLGIGLGASSLVHNIRYRNTRDLGLYQGNAASPETLRRDIQFLSVKEQMEEFMFLGLRMMEGISKKRFFREFGASVEEIYGSSVEKLKKEGLLSENWEKLWLTRRGISLSNRAFVEFLIDER